MPLTLDQVADCLVRTELMSETIVAETCDTLRDEGVPLDGEQLIDHLAESGKLTPYQAGRIRDSHGYELLIGNYLILAKIGAGGMGTVYKALHRRMQRVVALKLLRKDDGFSPSFVARFQREVQAAARLNHPNAVAAYDADNCELGHFLVMEYIEGSDLYEIVAKSGPLPVNDAIDAIQQAATGLGYAHSQGVIHRDVKPANLMRDFSGIVKIADLGLARLELSEEEIAESAALTQAGTVAGTVDYMSPEQALDTATVDQRADIYSLGCTFFYLLTGKPVFEESSLMKRLLAHRENPVPSLCDVRAGVPQKLDDIFQKMVTKNRDDRYQSMDDVVDDLDALRPTETKAETHTWQPAESTIFVIEPSRMLAGMAQRFLNELGADDIHVYQTAEEALTALATMPADVVVASMQLSDATGLELAARIRDDLRWSRTAIVLMTSQQPRDLVESSRRYAGISLLGKPFDGATLEAAISAAVQSNEIADSELANLSGLQVLVVDDSRVAQRHMQKVLTDLGFANFITADDGLTAVAELQQRRFDLVVTDYNMPQMDGHQLISHIRNESTQPDVPIIMCTTEFDPAKLAPVYQMGVSAVCNKSFEPSLVRNVIVRLFQ